MEEIADFKLNKIKSVLVLTRKEELELLKLFLKEQIDEIYDSIKKIDHELVTIAIGGARMAQD